MAYGVQRGDGCCKSSPAVRKVVPELSARTRSKAGRSPPLREQKCGQGSSVRIQVVPRKFFSP